MICLLKTSVHIIITDITVRQRNPCFADIEPCTVYSLYGMIINFHVEVFLWEEPLTHEN